MTLHGSVTVAAAGTAAKLGDGASTTAKAAAWILLQAGRNNAGRIFIGGSTVSSSSFGAELSAGDSLSMPPCLAPNTYNLDHIFLDADNSGNLVTFIYEIV